LSSISGSVMTKIAAHCAVIIYWKDKSDRR
jgi:hypothetical protein